MVQAYCCRNYNGKLLSVIRNLYCKAKSCVKSNGKLSDYFNCNRGVRQGENLSSLLFAIFLNDFEFSVSRKYAGLSELGHDINQILSDDDVEHFLKNVCAALCWWHHSSCWIVFWITKKHLMLYISIATICQCHRLSFTKMKMIGKIVCYAHFVGMTQLAMHSIICFNVVFSMTKE